MRFCDIQHTSMAGTATKLQLNIVRMSKTQFYVEIVRYSVVIYDVHSIQIN